MCAWVDEADGARVWARKMWGKGSKGDVDSASVYEQGRCGNGEHLGRSTQGYQQELAMSWAADSAKIGLGGILERLERGVHLERLAQCLRALATNVVAVEAASESRPQVSGAADSSRD